MFGADTGTARTGSRRAITRPPALFKAVGTRRAALAPTRPPGAARNPGPPPDLADGAVLAGPPTASPPDLPVTAVKPSTSRSPWLVFGIVSIALFMSSLDGTIVATGLPILRRDLHTGLNWTAWTITAYQLGIVVAMPMAGRVADNLGRKRVFVGAALLFTASSLLCGLATNIDMLIALRVMQAAGGAAFMPAA